MANKLNPEAHQRRLAMIADGIGAVRIAKAEGVSQSTISHWAKRHKIVLPQDKRGPVMHWQTCLDAGMTAAAAAESLGLTASAANWFARRTGQKWARHFLRSQKDWQDCLDTGLTSVEAADRLGVSASSARNFAARTGQKWAPAKRGVSRAIVVPKAAVAEARVKVPLMVPRAVAQRILAEGRL
jgi:transposase